MSAYATPVSIRTLFAILVALAVLLAPAVTRAGEAFAAIPDHHAQMMKSGHCKAPPTGSDQQQQDDETTSESCCVSVCAGMAFTPDAPVAERLRPRVPVTFDVRTFRLGPPAEKATPPPRRA